MAYKRRTDGNHAEIANGFRQVGCRVHQTHALGQGFPDLTCFDPVSGHIFLVETKDGSLPPSRRKLSPAEARFHEEWDGSKLFIVESLEDVQSVVNNLRSEWSH